MQYTEGQKSDVNGSEAKAEVQTTAKYIQTDTWAKTGTERCKAKTSKGKQQ